jgi:hypothetical protein
MNNNLKTIIMKEELKKTKQYLESTLEELSDAYVNYSIDMDNETQLIEKALSHVNKLLAKCLEYSIAS